MNKKPFIIKTILDILEVYEHFDIEADGAAWLHTSNPLLDNKEPIDLILSGKTEQVKKILK